VVVIEEQEQVAVRELSTEMPTWPGWARLSYDDTCAWKNRYRTLCDDDQLKCIPCVLREAACQPRQRH
jgi:hypothetical protein